MSNIDIEKALTELPELISEAMENWRIASLERERFEALLSAKIMGEDPDLKVAQVRDRVSANDERYQLCLKEIKAESRYNLLYERLLAAKKMASLRTAF